MIRQILGSTLLAIGLIVIGFSMWQSYAIFTGKISPPIIFSTPPVSVKTNVSGSGNLQDQITKIASEEIQNQISQVFSPESITKTLNFLSWSLLATILILGGGTVSFIGIKLMN